MLMQPNPYVRFTENAPHHAHHPIRIFTKPRVSLAYTRNHVQDDVRRVSREHRDVITSNPDPKHACYCIHLDGPVIRVSQHQWDIILQQKPIN